EKLKNTLTNVKETDYRKIVRANTRFGQKLFKQILKNNRDKNILLSPPFIFLNLLMTLNCAFGSMRQKLADILELNGWAPEFINGSSSSLFLKLLNIDPRIILQVTNTFWIRKGIEIKSEFRRICEDHYGALFREINFLFRQTISKINQRVKETDIF